MTQFEILILVLNSIVLPLSAWTLKVVVELGNRQSASDASAKEWRQSRDHEIVAMRNDIARLQDKTNEIEIAMAKL
jgi:hypothetical protein